MFHVDDSAPTSTATFAVLHRIDPTRRWDLIRYEHQALDVLRQIRAASESVGGDRDRLNAAIDDITYNDAPDVYAAHISGR